MSLGLKHLLRKNTARARPLEMTHLAISLPNVLVRDIPMKIATTALISALLCGCEGPPPPEAPQLDEGSEPTLLVSQKASKSLAWYSLEGELLHEVSVSDHPHEFAISPDKTRLYMTDNGVMQIENAGEGGNKVSIIDLEARERIGEVDLGQWHRPHGIDLCRDGTLLVTTENPDQLLVIDLGPEADRETVPDGRPDASYRAVQP